MRIDGSTILIAAVAYYAWQKGWLRNLGVQPPSTQPGATPAPVPGLTEDQAALIIGNNRPDLCANISTWSGGQFNCSTDANHIALVKHWWNTLNPPERSQYGTLAAYATAMGWV
jgi:hypothetical protein